MLQVIEWSGSPEGETMYDGTCLADAIRETVHVADSSGIETRECRVEGETLCQVSAGDEDPLGRVSRDLRWFLARTRGTRGAVERQIALWLAQHKRPQGPKAGDVWVCEDAEGRHPVGFPAFEGETPAHVASFTGCEPTRIRLVTGFVSPSGVSVSDGCDVVRFGVGNARSQLRVYLASAGRHRTLLADDCDFCTEARRIFRGARLHVEEECG